MRRFPREVLKRLNLLEDRREERRRRWGGVLCALLGHPPVVEVYFGEVTCARCDAKVGDTIMSDYDLKEKVIVGHECRTCDVIIENLGFLDRLLTKVTP